MRKTLTLLVITLLVLANAGWIYSQQNEEDEKFLKAVENYLDTLWKFYPTAGTMAGFHKYDNKLEDLDSGDIEKRHDELDELNQAFVARVDKLKLSPDFQIDHEIMVEALDLELIRHESLVPWAYNPLFYNQIIKDCVRSVLASDFGSPEDRAKNAAERLKELPKLIKQARENLQTPPQIYTETAIQQFEAILAIYQNDLPALIAEAPASQKGKLEENLNKALPELTSYQTYLQNELLPKSTGNFRLAAAHNRLTRIKLQNDIPLQDLVARAQADEKNIRRQMLLICMPFWNIMDPPFDLNSPPSNLNEEQIINVVVNHVMERFKIDHGTPAEFMQSLLNQKEQVKAYIEEKQIVQLPDAELTIAEMPLEDQGLTWTRLASPRLYDSAGGYTLLVGALTGDIGEEAAQGFLEEYNNYLLPFYVMRKIFPGDFVPAYFTDTNTTSMVRKMHPSIPLRKGWPLFVEDMCGSSGYGSYDLRMRLYQLKYRLKAGMDLVLDLNVHQGGMTQEQAIAYMTRQGFQSEAEAERNWNRIALNPGDALMPYVGLQELLDMEKTYQQKMGESFSRAEFLSKVLSYGNIPLRHLKRKIAE